MRWLKSWLGWGSGPRLIDTETATTPFEIVSEDQWRYTRHGVAMLTTNTNGDAWCRYLHPFPDGVEAESAAIYAWSDSVHLKVVTRWTTTEGFMVRAYRDDGRVLCNERITFRFVVRQQKPA